MNTNIYDLETPALLVDGDILARNIAQMAEVARTGAKALRPHAKTHKTIEIAQMQIVAGASGLTVAKLGEAEVYADAGCTNLFIANQIVGPAKIARLIELSRRASVRIGVDSLEVAEPLAQAAQSAGLRLPVLVEADTGLGRAGTRSTEETLHLAERIAELPGLEFVGFFSHEGHLYRAASAAERKTMAQQTANDLRALSLELQGQGTPAKEISIGSTPGAELLACEPGPTELRPGTYVFLDRMQVRMGSDPNACALTVLATVTSVRPDGRIILDAGTKSLASDCPFPDRTWGEIVGRPDLVFVGASEEHGHLQAEGSPNLRVGDKVRIVPNHACTCVNMHEELIVFRNETVEDRWKIAARGKIQ